MRELFFIAFILTFGVGQVVPQTQSSERTGADVIAQIPSPLSLEVVPAVDVPLADSAAYFSFGGGANVGVSYRIPGTIVFVAGGLQYSFAPDRASSTLSMAGLRGGGGVRVPLTPAIAVLAYGDAGYWYGTYNDFSASSTDPYVDAGVGIQFAFGSMFNVGITAQYDNYLGLYQGIRAGIGTSVALGNLGGSVDIPTVELQPAFPVFYKYYDDHPIGKLQITSHLKVSATNLRAQVFVKQFMDDPKEVDIPGTLRPGESKSVDLYALFTDRVLGVTEGTKASAEISLSYTVDGRSYQDHKIETVTLLGRNAMTWDDNRKAAAYVTAKDPQVLDFARSITSYVRSKESRSINENLQAAIALHEALDLYGLNYVPNPVTPYSEVSKKQDVVDFLQFPRETFQYKAGDCSDLSILYSALLQAVGIDAAFVTIPGHIFVAVNTGLTPDQAKNALIPTGEFISYGGQAWIPVEITMRHEGFLKAWQLGAKEWNENAGLKQAGFYPVQEAWTAYPAVALPGSEPNLSMPSTDQVFAHYLAEAQKWIEGALYPQVARLQAQIQQSASPSAMNSLGILYAKYGETDKAELEFKQALKKTPFLPALLNLGNLYYLKNDWNDALTYYRQASELDPENPRALLAVARVNLELQKYDESSRGYEKLKQLDPALASQYAYLGQNAESGARAADIAAERRAVVWEGE